MFIRRTKYFAVVIGLLSLAALNNCKRPECKDSDITIHMLKPHEKNSIRYTGMDTVVFISGRDSIQYTSGYIRQYFNTATSAAGCEGVSRKMEGFQIVLKNNAGNDSIFHMHYVSFTDTASSAVTIGYMGRNFNFDYIILKAPYVKDYTIDGRTFKNVAVTSIKNSNDSAYYSLEHGIIRIVLTSKGKTLQQL